MAKRGSKSCNLQSVIFMILVIIVVYFVGNYILNFIRKEGFEGKKELLLLHMEGCGHCKTLMPEWKAAEKANNSGISMRAVEKDDNNGPELCEKHNVTGFPTMLLLDENGEKLDTYSGDRTKEGLLNYLKNN